MKGLFNNVLLLACAGIFSTTLATPSHAPPSYPHVQFTDVKASEEAIEDRFYETNDVCQKAVLALYKVHKYIDDKNMEAACDPDDNKYTRFLDSDFHCKQEKYNRYFIETGLAQRNYYCSKNKLNNYCYGDLSHKYYAEYIEGIQMDLCIEEKGDNCLNQLVEFFGTMEDAFYNSSKKTITTTVPESDESDSDSLFTVLVTRPDDDKKENTAKICEHPTGVNKKKVSKDGTCGAMEGVCPSGECCNNGKCGTSSKYCDVSRGCDSDFGECNDSKKTTTKTKTTKTKTTKKAKTTTKKTTTKTKKTTTTKAKKTTTKASKATKVSTDGKCGGKYVCPSGNCCSKYGWCGKTDLHCGAGCQSEFGKCN